MNIVAVSISQLDDQTARDHDIHILDYPFFVNGEQYDVHITDPPAHQDGIRAIVLNRNNRCTTSGVNEAQLLEIYEKLADAPFLSVHQGRAWSEVSYAAMNKIAQERPEIPCTIVNTHHTTAGYTVQLLQLARTLADGRSWEDHAERYAIDRRNTAHIGAIPDLFFLHRSGRIGLAKALLGTAMKAIPLLTIRDEVESAKPFGRVRSYAQANLRMVRAIEQDLERVGGDRVEIVVAWYGPHEAERDHLLSLIREKGWRGNLDVFTGKFSAAPHLGPDYWEVGYTVHAD